MEAVAVEDAAGLGGAEAWDLGGEEGEGPAAAARGRGGGGEGEEELFGGGAVGGGFAAAVGVLEAVGAEAGVAGAPFGDAGGSGIEEAGDVAGGMAGGGEQDDAGAFGAAEVGGGFLDPALEEGEFGGGEGDGGSGAGHGSGDNNGDFERRGVGRMGRSGKERSCGGDAKKLVNAIKKSVMCGVVRITVGRKLPGNIVLGSVGRDGAQG